MSFFLSWLVMIDLYIISKITFCHFGFLVETYKSMILIIFVYLLKWELGPYHALSKFFIVLGYVISGSICMKIISDHLYQRMKNLSTRKEQG